jgi:3-hydroxyacyl-CoA dehydrogenase
MMENSAKPIVAALNGTAFGGGLEVALCCDYRVAAPTAPVGLPEVKLGLLPGAGGTQRLPRLIGAEQALQFILTGDPIPAPKAKALGIVDEVIDGNIARSATRAPGWPRTGKTPRSSPTPARTPRSACAAASRRK